MYKAHQEALFQATNQGLVNIRQSEINYYLSVNSAIGTQAALIGGFTYGIFTQNQVNMSNPWSQSCQTVYFIVTAITIASAVHVIINTMLLQVLGPGLALNGPIGSMARATEGMQIEQSQVIWSFTVMIVSFSMSTVLAFWVVMDVVASTGSTLVFAIAARFWFVYGKRVFLRFYWDSSAKNTTWSTPAAEDDDEPTMPGKAVQLNGVSSSKSPIHNTSTLTYKTTTAAASSGRNESDQQKSTESSKSSPKSGSRIGNVLDWLKPTEKEIRDSLCEADRYFAEEQQRNIAAQSKDVAMEGYMTKRGISRSEFIKDPWERRYFVLNYRGQIFYYKNRQEYREDPASRIKGRPIDLDEYFVISNACALDDTATVSTSATNKNLPSFQITLKSREDESFRQWMLRCDTEELLGEWLTAMNSVSPSSFPYSGANNV